MSAKIEQMVWCRFSWNIESTAVLKTLYFPSLSSDISLAVLSWNIRSEHAIVKNSLTKATRRREEGFLHKVSHIQQQQILIWENHGLISSTNILEVSEVVFALAVCSFRNTYLGLCRHSWWWCCCFLVFIVAVVLALYWWHHLIHHLHPFPVKFVFNLLPPLALCWTQTFNCC